MNIRKTKIEGLLIFEPMVFKDNRGEFSVPFEEKIFKNNISEKIHFVQDNESVSRKGVVRGLHFQNPPYDQGKLVRVVNGCAFDVAVDIRKNSATYGEHVSLQLSAKNKLIFWIPPGFAHGFLAQEENTIFSYKCTSFYHSESEGNLLWNDPDLNIDWPISTPLLSPKDSSAARFSTFASQF